MFVSDMITLERCAIENDEAAIKAMKIIDDFATCHVPFLPKALLNANFISNIIGKLCQVIELHEDSASAYKRYLHHQNYG